MWTVSLPYEDAAQFLEVDLEDFEGLMHAVPLPITLLWFAHPLISISNPRCALAINSVVPLILFHEIFANHTWHFYYQHR